MEQATTLLNPPKSVLSSQNHSTSLSHSLSSPQAPPASTSTAPPFPVSSEHMDSLLQPPTSPKRRPRFSFTSLRQSLSLSRSPPSSLLHSDDCPPTIGHQARMCYVVMTGALPPDTATKGTGKGKLKKVGKENQSPETPLQQKKDVKPVVKVKAVKKLKSDLTKPDKARAIVADLKRMEIPQESSTSSNSSTSLPATSSHPVQPRGFSLPPVIEEDSSDTTPSFVDYSQPAESNPRPPFTILDVSSPLFPTSEGSLAGLASAKSGAFEILADVSGALVRRSGVREGFVAPFDAVAVFIYWWGYEISLPPPILLKLGKVQSVQQTFFGFMQAFFLAGGAPELAPFIRYISSYLDMEFSAIQSQNKGGQGVVLAATWLLPVALVPRPWDFPPQPPSKEKGRKSLSFSPALPPLTQPLF